MQKPPTVPPFPAQLIRNGGGPDPDDSFLTALQLEGGGSATAAAGAQLRSAIAEYKSSGDDEALLEELHQALSRGLDEQSQEVSETLKILWDAEKSRAEIENASQVDHEEEEDDSAGDGSFSAASVDHQSDMVQQPRERAMSSGSALSRASRGMKVESVSKGKPPPYPPPRRLEYNNANNTYYAAAGERREDYDQQHSMTPSFHEKAGRGQANFNSSFPGSAMSNASTVRSVAVEAQHRGGSDDSGSKVIFLNQQLLEEQRSYVQHLRFLENERAELLRLEDQRNVMGAPVSDNDLDLAQLNVLRATQAVRSKKEIIDALHAMLGDEDHPFPDFGRDSVTTNNARGDELSKFDVRTSTSLLSEVGGRGQHPTGANAHNITSAGTPSEQPSLANNNNNNNNNNNSSDQRDTKELQRLEHAVQDATQRLQHHRDELVADIGREEAEQVVEMLLNDANLATTKYKDSTHVKQLAAALDDLEQAQTRRNEYFLVGKIFDRQMVVREIKRITNPKIAKISRIIKKLNSIFSEAGLKMDSVTKQQEKLADDIDQLLERMDGAERSSKSTARRMSKLETRINGIYKLLGISESASSS